jgi:hypothetical protein
MSGLDGLRLKKALATLRGIEHEIEAKKKWMATLMSFKGNPIDARDLLDICTRITKESIALEHTIAGLAVEARSLGRSLPSMPPKQLTLSKYTPSSGGELKELAAITGRMPKKMAELRASIDKFRAFATNKMNDPNRTSDGQPMDPAGMFLAFLDLLLKWKNL